MSLFSYAYIDCIYKICEKGNKNESMNFEKKALVNINSNEILQKKKKWVRRLTSSFVY